MAFPDRNAWTNAAVSRGKWQPTSIWSCSKQNLAPRRKLVVVFVVAFTVVIGLGLGGGFSFRQSIIDASTTSVGVDFNSTANSITHILDDTMQHAVASISVLATTVMIFNNLSFAEFLRLSSSVRSGIRNPILQWAPRVLDADRAGWEAFISSELHGSYSMQMLQNGSVVNSTTKPSYLPISYLDPLAGNTKAVLLDLFSNPSRLAAVMAAQSTALPVLSEPVPLVQYPAGSNLGFVVFVPVFQASCENITFANASMHESCFIGVINGVWRFQDLLASVLQTFSNKDLYLVMTDVAASAVVFVGETAPSGTIVHFTNYTLPVTSHAQHQQVSIGGRVYNVSIFSLRMFGQALDPTRNSNIVFWLCIGLMVLFLFALLLCMTLWAHREQQQRDRILIKSKASADEIDASREAHSAVVGYICHELRNPMHVVNAGCRLLMDLPDGDASVADRRSLVHDVFSALHQMKSTVDNVLNFRTVQHGGGRDNVQLVSVQPELRNTILAARGFISHASTLSYTLPAADCRALLDTAKMHQILTVGITHACRNTVTGTIRVFCDVVVAFGERYLVVDVCHHGSSAGSDASADPATQFIPFSSLAGPSTSWHVTAASQDHKTQCREVWLQTLPSRSSAQGTLLLPEENEANPTNTGLDLPLARAYAAACGGWLSIEDDVDGNSHFWCVMVACSPAEAFPATIGDDLLSPALPIIQEAPTYFPNFFDYSQLRVVIVDDSPPNRRILAKYLLKLRVPSRNIVELVDGGQASDFLLDRTCDVMFMDIEMPVLNGDKVVEKHRPKFPVIAVTGNVGQEAYYLRVGFHSILLKPFGIPQLKAALEASIGLDMVPDGEFKAPPAPDKE